MNGSDVLQSNLHASAHERTQSHVTIDDVHEEMKDASQNDEALTCPSKGFYLVSWTCNAENELKIKEEYEATMRCCPLDEDIVEDSRCFIVVKVLIARLFLLALFRMFVCFFMKKMQSHKIFNCNFI